MTASLDGTQTGISTVTSSQQEHQVSTGDAGTGTQDSLPHQPSCDAEVMKAAVEGIARELGKNVK